MLQPKRTKFRKMQKGKVKGSATRGHSIAFGWQMGERKLPRCPYCLPAF